VMVMVDGDGSRGLWR